VTVAELPTLIHLQEYDTRIARLEAALARLPREIEALQAALAEARKETDGLRARLETGKKELRAKEKDLDDVGAKRSKSEAKLWEVKTNTEYSAVLKEIEDIKRAKARIEEEILALMELQERLAVDLREAEGRLKARETRAREEEAVIRGRLAAVEAELAGVRGERASLARELPRPLLSDYEKILRARSGLAVVPVTSTAICGGCRVTIRPQVLQELRAADAFMVCESCGRYLYWQESA
jgi:uncharacterized protein